MKTPRHLANRRTKKNRGFPQKANLKSRSSLGSRKNKRCGGMFNSEKTLNSTPDNKYTIKHWNGDVYTGELKDVKCKQGIYNKVRGIFLLGDKRCIKKGNGTMTYANGDVYAGNWNDDKKEGEGTAKYMNGDVYAGNWNDDKKEGKGIYTYKDSGDIYEGNWKNNKMEGKGIYTYNDSGDIYTFNWADNIMKGEGEIKYANGNVYKGNIRKQIATDDYLKDNYGKMTWKESGDVYDGFWLNDNMNGKGKMKWSNGNTYDGRWLNGKMNDTDGSMMYTTGEMTMRRGSWKDGEIDDSKDSFIIYKTYSEYKGYKYMPEYYNK